MAQKCPTIFMLGIAGAGMAALARILHLKSYRILGYDQNQNTTCAALGDLGVDINHDMADVDFSGVDQLVYSSAFSLEHPLMIKAKQAGISCVSRARCLADCMQGYEQIAIAGSHGKSTIAALLCYMLLQQAFMPSYAIGAPIAQTTFQGHVDEGQHFIFEADESQNELSYYAPQKVLLSNISADHLGAYGNNFDALLDQMHTWLSQLDQEALLVYNQDDPHLADIVPGLTCKRITYGCSAASDARIEAYRTESGFSYWNVSYQGRSYALSLPMPGLYNAYNATGAFIMAIALGACPDALLQDTQRFPGLYRRAMACAKYRFASGHHQVLADYGHHPKEIQAYYHALKTRSDTKLCVVFQPHRYSRTKALWQDFVRVLSEMDKLILLDIYAADEAKDAGVSSYGLFQDLQKTMKNVYYCPDKAHLYTLLNQVLEAKDTIVLQGAGDVFFIPQHYAWQEYALQNSKMEVM